MNNERFAVPEILFRPSDVGVQEMGITESLVHSIGTTNEGKSAIAGPEVIKLFSC